MGTVLQLDPQGTVTEQDPISISGFVTTTGGTLNEGDTVLQQFFKMLGSNTSIQIRVMDVIYGSPNEIREPQYRLYTYDWINQMFHYPITDVIQGRSGTMQGIVVTLDRKVPGGAADPVSGRIPQIEVPTKTAITGTGADDSNPGTIANPFPAHTLIF